MLPIDNIEYKVLLNLISVGLGNEEIFCFSCEETEKINWAKVMIESSRQAVSLLAFDSLSKNKKNIPEEIYKKWFELSAAILISNSNVNDSQKELTEFLEKSGYDYFILKGLSAASYYPKPELRGLGDVDFLVNNKDVNELCEEFEQAGFKKLEQDHICHIVYYKERAQFEMHFEIAGIPYGKPGETVREFMADAMKEVHRECVDGYFFNVPTPFYHAIVLILHMQHHMLGEGLGLRHLCDWATFVNKTHKHEFWKSQLIPALKKIGIWKYAEIMTKTSVDYLGIEPPEWVNITDEEISFEIINDILSGGNFGCKDSERQKSNKFISQHGKSGTKNSRLKNVLINFIGTTKIKFPIVNKCRILFPLLFIWNITEYVFLCAIGRKKGTLKVIASSKKRKQIYDKFDLFKCEEV